MPKTILVHTEASYLATGYAVYSYEILKRLHSTGKYRVVEYANYGAEQDPRRQSLPWEFFGVLPNNDQEKQVYESNPIAQFGGYKFEEALLKYQPDIVYSMLDIWMNDYQLTSPFRRNYNLFWMPTVDSEPQPMEWVTKYEQCDGVFTYTKWGENHLRTLSDRIKYCGQASPAADYSVFRPMNSKEFFGYKDKFIIGTTMRNQKRKLFPNLIQAFCKLLDKDPKIREVAYLYLHTAWPDNGWNIPDLIKNCKYPSRILLTYKCHSCGAFYPSVYSDALAVCKNCGNLSASMPNTTNGLTREQLAAVYNVFDYYAQYANCFAPGTEICTSKGWKNIENIKKNDLVLTHNQNWKKVTQLFKTKKQFINKVNIKANFESVYATDEHPFLIVKNSDLKQQSGRSKREALGRFFRKNNKLPDLVFTELKNINPGDLLVQNIDNSTKDVDCIELEQDSIRSFVSNQTIYYYNNKKIPNILKSINIDNDFCKFLGLYVADGYSRKTLFRITQNINEEDNKKFLGNFFTKTGLQYYVRPYKDRNAIDFHVNCHSLANWLAIKCSKKEDKQLPEFCEFLPPEKQKSLIIGLFSGDGHYCESKKVSIYVTISKKLAKQICFILDRLRIPYYCRFQDRTKDNLKDGKKRKNIYRIECGKSNIAKGIFATQCLGDVLYYDNYKVSTIKSITRMEHNDFTYNFEVEDDNSYVTRIGTVHNCEGFGMTVPEAAACQIPVCGTDYSSLCSVVPDCGGNLIKVKEKHLDPDKNTYFAIPDDEDFIEKVRSYFYLPEHEKTRKKVQAREKTMKSYSYDKTVENLMKYFDSSKEVSWSGPPDIRQPNPNVPKNISNSQLVDWAIINILNRPEWLGTYFSSKLLKDLNQGCKFSNGPNTNEMSILGVRNTNIPYGPNEMLNELAHMRSMINFWEERRIQTVRGNK